MSIFKETFPKFVTDQLEIREEVIASGTGRKKRGDFGFGEKNRSTEFYTYSANKQCVIRLSSAVDIIDPSIWSEETGGGSSVAAQWVLESGIQDKGSELLNKQRRGFSTPGVGSAYGDSAIKSDAKDGYGIVPMPGITSATVRTKSAYGSLREGKVNFVCHNRRQLEVLELLYMRPGYSLMLEWGWNPYIDNDGNATNWNYIQNFFDQKTTTADLEKQILKKKEDTGGNYDALIGYCKNFTYKLRADGGFDCTTEIIAKGEVITSIKDKDELIYDDENVYVRPSLELIFQDLINYADDVEGVKNKKADEKREDVKGNDKKARALMINAELRDKLELDDLQGTGDPTDDDEDPNVYGEDTIKPWVIIDGPMGYQTKDYYTAFDDDEKIKGYRVTTTWIRWDALAHMINKYVIPNDDFDQGLIEFQTFRVANEHTSDPKIRPYLYSNVLPKFIASKLPEITAPSDLFGLGNAGLHYGQKRRIDWFHCDVSLNQEICILPHTLYNHYMRLEGAITTTPKDMMYKPLAKKLAERVQKKGNVTQEEWVKSLVDRKLESHENYFNIGGIYLGVEWMMSLFKSMYYDKDGNASKDYSLFKFFEKVWEGVSSTSGDNHEFVLHTDNRPEGKTIRVIDMQANIDPEVDLANVHQLQIQSLDSVVRDVSYNTTIPNSLSATIAIAAQAPDSVDDLDKVTFAALNKGIRDRFATDYSVEGDQKIFGDKGEEEQRKLWNREFDKNLLAIFEALHIFNHEDNSEWMEEMGEGQGFGLKWWEIALVGIGYVVAPWIGLTVAVAGVAKKAVKLKQREFGGMLRDLVYYQYTINDNQYLREEGPPDIQNEETAKYRGALKSLWTAINYFQKVYGSDDESNKPKYYRGQPYEGATRSTSSIIPLKFNAKLDGISGIVIGNIFKLPKDRLPLAYNGDDIFFIVMGENQTITADQDWHTTITGHLTILGEEIQDTQRHKLYTESWDNVNSTIDRDNIHFDVKSYSTRKKSANSYVYEDNLEAYVDTDVPEENLQNPIRGKMKVNSKFELDGKKTESFRNGRPHTGVDLRSPSGNVAYAVWDGVIEQAEDVKATKGNGCGGNIRIKFKSREKEDGSRTPTYPGGEKAQQASKPAYAIYCHLKSFSVKVGDVVKKGDAIGRTGGAKDDPMRGTSTGAHLHFGLKNASGKWLNPVPWLSKEGSSKKISETDIKSTDKNPGGKIKKMESTKGKENYFIKSNKKTPDGDRLWYMIEDKDDTTEKKPGNLYYEDSGLYFKFDINDYDEDDFTEDYQNYQAAQD